MNNSPILSIEELLSKMYEYQKQNDIKGQCITNTQFVFNYIKKHYPTKQLKTVAVIAVGDLDEPNAVVIGCNHILLKIDDKIIEPSYEYITLLNVAYYFSYEDFFLTEYEKGFKCEYSKIKYLQQYMRMLCISTQINITNNYNKYIDYSYYHELDKLIK